jgi:phosphatidylinositol alpha-1,6-mannosyltransferase
VEHKGVDNGIRAFALLSPDYPDLGYAVAGVGEIQPSLVALARSLGVGERVRFLGSVPDDCLPQLLNTATIYLGPSREMHDKVEGFGIALVEASACGVPVVGGASGGIPDAVRDGETGLLTDPESPPAIAATLRRLLDDEVLRARLGAGGRAAVESHYNWERVTADMRGIAASSDHGRAVESRAGSVIDCSRSPCAHPATEEVIQCRMTLQRRGLPVAVRK